MLSIPGGHDKEAAYGAFGIHTITDTQDSADKVLWDQDDYSDWWLKDD